MRNKALVSIPGMIHESMLLIDLFIDGEFPSADRLDNSQSCNKMEGVFSFSV